MIDRSTRARQDTVRLCLLHGFEVKRGDDVIMLPPCSERVAAFVALHERPLLRSFVSGSLWPESTQDRANASLRSALWRLHQAYPLIGDATNGRLQIAPGVSVDIVEATALARRALDPEDKLSPAEVRTLCTSGEMLPDWYDDWVIIDRERFRQLHIHALETLCERLADAGRFGEAVEAALAAIAAEPLRESGHRQLIRLHLSEGNFHEARRHFQLVRQLLRVQLGTEPSPRLAEMIPHLRGGDGAVTRGEQTHAV